VATKKNKSAAKANKRPNFRRMAESVVSDQILMLQVAPEVEE
jgi:hypothetical protein